MCCTEAAGRKARRCLLRYGTALPPSSIPFPLTGLLPFNRASSRTYEWVNGQQCLLSGQDIISSSFFMTGIGSLIFFFYPVLPSSVGQCSPLPLRARVYDNVYDNACGKRALEVRFYSFAHEVIGGEWGVGRESLFVERYALLPSFPFPPLLFSAQLTQTLFSAHMPQSLYLSSPLSDSFHPR